VTITVHTDQEELTFSTVAKAEAALIDGGWRAREKSPAEWVKASPTGSRFASVRDAEQQEAFTPGRMPAWTAATVTSNHRVVYTVTASSGEAHQFPGWHAAELMAKELGTTVVITTAAFAAQDRS